MSSTFTPPTNPVELLEGLVLDGVFNSQHEAYLEREMRGSNAPDWYTKLLDSEGLYAAEAQLATWVKNGYSDVFTNALALIADGVLQVARAKPELLVVAPMHEMTSSEYRVNQYSRVILWNSPVPGCGCAQPESSRVFGPYGELELHGIILETGYTHRGRLSSKVSLITPRWSNDSKYTPNGSFAQLVFDTSGRSDGYSFLPHRRDGDKATDDVDRRAAMNYAFKLEPKPEGVVIMVGSEGLFALNFPGAHDYLGKHMSSLPEYLQSMAAKLSGSHSH